MSEWKQPQSVAELAAKLGYDQSDPARFCGSRADSKAVWVNARRGGKARQAFEPAEPLKEIQRRITKRILRPLVRRSIAADVRGRGQHWACDKHVAKRWVARVDIEDFFNSVTSKTLRGLFRSVGFSRPVTDTLVRLLTREGVIPTGSPSSPMLAHLLLQEIDEALAEFCFRHGLRCTRFADDIALSGSDRAAIEDAIRFVESELGRLGLRLNSKKTSMTPRWKRQEVLGLIVNEKLSVPKRQVSGSKALSRAEVATRIERSGQRGLLAEGSVADRVRGQIAWVERTNPRSAARMANRVSQYREDADSGAS